MSSPASYPQFTSSQVKGVVSFTLEENVIHPRRIDLCAGLFSLSAVLLAEALLKDVQMPANQYEVAPVGGG